MKILLLNQCFYPDVVSTAQHLTDLAVELAERGHSVTVVAGQRGYDNPAAHFPRREVWRKIEIIRVPTLGLGKSAKWRRVLDFASFMVCCVWRLLFLSRFDAVVALTSPPLISFIGALFVRLRGGRFFFWVMDLNPDEAIAAGWLKDGSPAAGVLQRLLLYSLRRAEKILVLDRFMKERIIKKGIAEQRIAVIPPWSHDDAVRFDERGRRAFRAEHGLSDKYVVMYSGNHSPCHPLDTLLEAARRLSDQANLIFCFVGGGGEYHKVKTFVGAHELKNILCLPYQPLDKLAASLSAADMHVVVMGDAFRGIVHPCKIYNILAIGTPFLYIGPAQSHVGDIVSQLGETNPAFVAQHGEVEQVVQYIAARARSESAQQSQPTITLAGKFSKETLLPRMLEVLETNPGRKFAPLSDGVESNVHSF